jgi:hypothetical protein
LLLRRCPAAFEVFPSLIGADARGFGVHARTLRGLPPELLIVSNVFGALASALGTFAPTLGVDSLRLAGSLARGT